MYLVTRNHVLLLIKAKGFDYFLQKKGRSLFIGQCQACKDWCASTHAGQS